MAPMIRSRRDRVRAFFAKNAAEVRRPGRPFVILRSLALFVLAGLCEIGGGYLVWQWWRNGAPRLVGHEARGSASIRRECQGATHGRARPDES